jgi:hypothetical protein
MAQVLRDFVPESTAINWGGIDFSGFAPDTYVTASRNSPNTTNSVGADGSVGITKNADKTGTIEVTLMQTSNTHRYLAAVQAGQDVGSAQLIRAPMTIVDPSGGFIAVAEGVHIMTPPEVSLGSDQNPKTWTFFAERLIYSELPPGFVATAGEVTRITNAVAGAVEISERVLQEILS